MTKTIKELNTRVEQLAELFEKGFQELKSFHNHESDCNAQVDSTKCNLDNKLKNFEELITSSLQIIKSDIIKMKKEMEEHSHSTKRLELKRNLNILIIHGVKENKSDIYEDIINLFTRNFNFAVKKADINMCYRLGQKGNDKKPRPIVVDFIHRWVRDQIFFSKKKLIGTKMMITEMLTPNTVALFKEIRQVMGKAAWTMNGLIVVLHNERKITIKSESDWLKMKNEIVNT